MEDTNQHYITRAYLDKFIHPSSSQQVLYPFERRKGACKPRGPKHLGSHNNFFRQVDNGAITDKLDWARGFTEAVFFGSGKRNPSSLAQLVFDENFNPTAQDRLHLATCAAFLFCSSPVQIHNTAMNLLLLEQLEFLNKFSTEEMHAVYVKNYGDDAEKRIVEDRQKVLDGKLFVDVGEENWRQLGFFIFQIEMSVINLIQEMKMTIVNCHPKSNLLTSDNPVVRTYPTTLKSKDDQVWFPISHKRGVLWHRNKSPEKTTLGHSQIRSLNRRVIKHAYKHVYSPMPEDWIEPAVIDEQFDPLYGHYGTLNEVMKHKIPVPSFDGQQPIEIVDMIAAMKAGKKHDVVRIGGVPF